MADLIQFPRGFEEKDIVAWGSTGLVCLDAVSQTVIKTPHDNDSCSRVQVEKTIYERFTSEAGIADSCDTTARTIPASALNSLRIGTSHRTFANTLRSELSKDYVGRIR